MLLGEQKLEEQQEQGLTAAPVPVPPRALPSGRQHVATSSLRHRKKEKQLSRAPPAACKSSNKQPQPWQWELVILSPANREYDDNSQTHVLILQGRAAELLKTSSQIWDCGEQAQ